MLRQNKKIIVKRLFFDSILKNIEYPEIFLLFSTPIFLRLLILEDFEEFICESIGFIYLFI